MAKSVAIVQSCYIPWKGYFDLIRNVDEFILYDDRQFTRRDWRNRNRIKTPQGIQWLTIPVETKGRYHQRIDETLISDTSLDQLTGSSGADLFFISLGDKVTDLKVQKAEGDFVVYV